MRRRTIRLRELLQDKASPYRSKSSIYQKIAEGKFPPPRKLNPGDRVVFWFEDEIEAVQNGTWMPSKEPEAARFMSHAKTAKPATALHGEPASNLEQLGGQLIYQNTQSATDRQALRLRQIYAMTYHTAVTIAELAYRVPA